MCTVAYRCPYTTSPGTELVQNTMATKKVAVVTGSNQGVGFAAVRALCKQWDGDVFLTARDARRGHKAVEELEKEGLHPKFHQLDITQKSSIAALKAHLLEHYGGLDILVNNAGIAYKQASTAPFAEQAEVTIATNYFATLDVCDALFPILRSHARVVNVSGIFSQFALAKCSEPMKDRILAARTIGDITGIMNDFIQAAKDGNHKAKGYPESAYGMSKVGVTAATIVQQAEIDKDTSRTDIVINVCCPGYVLTNMSSYKGQKTIDEGADTPVYLALLPPNEQTIRGKFLSDRKIIDRGKQMRNSAL